MALHVETRGTPGRPAVLFLHGLLSSNLQWELHRPAFDPVLRWFCAELWGHGRSPAPAEPHAYSGQGYVEELEAARRAFGVERWVLVGQSLGAGLMIRYALTHPEVVRGLVLTNSLSAFSQVVDAARAPKLEELRAADLRALPVHPCHAKRFPAELRERMALAADRVDREALWRAITETTQSTCSRDQVSKLTRPTLLVNGLRERAFQPHRAFAAEAIPGISIRDLDAGHAVNVEAPREFETALLQFVASASARP
ncbi:MAG TPA: alpha/beta hydrolase [Myxococcota bacterium]|nr:alpha/beta hydrolase [Myxococcota bacterium]